MLKNDNYSIIKKYDIKIFAEVIVINTTALIMAGGKGERFWPKSRKAFPKQFLSLTNDGKTMIQHTVERILPIVDMKDIFIATNKEYKEIVKTQLPEIPEENILCEPVGKNTAPCIGLAAAHIGKKYEDAIMIVLPSDHLIKFTDMFVNTLKAGCEIAENDENLVTVGIMPSYPETGYGYIKFIPNKDNSKEAYKVEKFVEKPKPEIAKEYVSCGEYLWNSGMFIWKISTILKKFEEFLPDTFNGILKIKDSIGKDDYKEVLEREFNLFNSESIDYGIMEKASNIYILPGAFGWDDVGSWLAIERINKTNEFGNMVSGNVINVNTKNSIIVGTDKLIATVGLEDIVIVDTEDATLICDKNSTQDIKKVLEVLKTCNKTEYI